MTTSPDPTPLRLCVLTVSDSPTLAEDSSGDYLVAALQADGHRLHARTLLLDDRYRMRAVVSMWRSDYAVAILLRNDATGFTGRTSTTQAVRPLLYQATVGIGARFCASALQP